MTQKRNFIKQKWRKCPINEINRSKNTIPLITHWSVRLKMQSSSHIKSALTFSFNNRALLRPINTRMIEMISLSYKNSERVSLGALFDLTDLMLTPN